MNPLYYANINDLAWALAGSHLLEEAKAVCRQAIGRKADSANTHLILYNIAFRQQDAGAMEREVAWAKGKPREHDMLAAEASVAAAQGRLELAREISRRSIDQALRANLPEWAALELAWLAFLEVSFGDRPQALKQAAAEFRAVKDGGLGPVALAPWSRPPRGG